MTQLTRAQFLEQINTLLPDNGMGDISAADMRQMKIDLADSIIWHDEGGSHNEIITLGSRYLLDPNEYAGWSSDGIIDQTMTADLGNVGGSISRTAGGVCYPYDVKVVRLFAWHYNSNEAVLPWGFRIAALAKTAGSNSVSYTDILRQCVGAGATAIAPNDYGNITTQLTDVAIDEPVIPAGQLINFGVEAPTAVTTNYYVQMMGGFIEIEPQ